MTSPDTSLHTASTKACDAAVRGHIERLVGTIAEAFPAGGGIEICHVAPSERRPFHTLITCGMSARPMEIPASAANAPRYLELMMTLPEDWQLDRDSRTQPNWNWPIAELTRLAALPAAGQWLGWGHAIPNGTPAVPYAPDTKLCGVIIAPSLLVKEAFYELQLDRRQVAFFSAIPLYREELAIRERDGMEKLLGKLIDNEINDVVEIKRRNVGKRFFGLF
jgi:hypothetical protein